MLAIFVPGVLLLPDLPFSPRKGARVRASQLGLTEGLRRI